MTQPGIEQTEGPPSVPIQGGMMRWFATKGTAVIQHPDDRQEVVKLVRLRMDDDKGIHYYTFTADDFTKFAAWCQQQAAEGRTGIISAQQLPPGLGLPDLGNGRPRG